MLGWWYELPLGSFRPITEGLLKTNPKHHQDPVAGGACHLFCLVYVYCLSFCLSVCYLFCLVYVHYHIKYIIISDYLPISVLSVCLCICQSSSIYRFPSCSIYISLCPYLTKYLSLHWFLYFYVFLYTLCLHIFLSVCQSSTYSEEIKITLQ